MQVSSQLAGIKNDEGETFKLEFVGIVGGY